MPALTKEKIESIVAAYRDDPSATVPAVAEALEVSEEAVRKHIGLAGIPERPDFGDVDDASLGIESPTVADITGSQAFKDAVAQAVAAAMAQTRPFTPPSETPEDWGEFMASMKQLAEALHVQRPGYAKPLAPEEIASRQAGETEFFRLLSEAEDAVENFGRRGAVERGLIPEYLVGDNGIYTETDKGEELFSPGQPIFMTKPPPVDFLPMNEAAARIMNAQDQWHGEEMIPIEQRVANAMIRAKGGDPDLGDKKRERRNRQFAEPVPDSEIVPMGPRRVMGTTVEADSDNGRGRFSITKGQVARPVSGPIFA